MGTPKTHCFQTLCASILETIWAVEASNVAGALPA